MTSPARPQTGHSVDEIRAFWDEQADQFGAELKATMYDPLAKELEYAALQRHLDPTRPALEVGCGNGLNLLQLASWFRAPLTGVDYSEKMISVARARAAKAPPAVRVRFEVANILDDMGWLGSFPQVLTVRCLINLPSREDHRRALANLAGLVPPGGQLVLVEHFEEGQERMNGLRELAGLPPIPYKWHNLYLREEELLVSLPDDLEHVATDNFASLYYLASRVFNAYLTPKGKEPDYLAEINKLACKLPSVGDCGPLKLMLLRKRS